MAKKNSGFMRIGFFSLVLLMSFVLVQSVSAMMVMRTVPQTTQWVADGVTQYRLDVYADTTLDPSVRIGGAEWNLQYPSFLNLVSAQIPSQQEDFFGGYQMFLNDLSTQPQAILQNSIVLTQSTRIISFNEPTGPSNENKPVAIYYFTVDPSYHGQPVALSFDLPVARLTTDTGSGVYERSAGTLNVQNQQFTIKPVAGTASCSGRFCSLSAKNLHIITDLFAFLY